jgi:capsular exopolysaccharide synthesis family protein
MERIRQALEHAARDREAAGKRVPAQGTGAVPSDGATQAVPQSTVAEVRHHRTRVVEVPEEVLIRNRLVAGIANHELQDVYRMLRTRVLKGLRGNGWNSLAITSPATGCGKTLTAINLAISLAMELVHTVLLVDLDLRNPTSHRYFGLEPEYGLSDYLLHNVPVEDILFSPSLDRLVVLPGRESVRNSSEMLKSPGMVALVKELKTRYPDRLVIFDLPPLLAVDDALAFAPYTDAMLMVAENGATQREDLERALTILKDTPVIGTVLNKSTPPRNPYYKKK